MNEIPIVVGIGSNTDDREYRVQQAIEALMAKFPDGRVSDVYESEAFNGKDAPYYNAVFAGRTEITEADTIALLKQMEKDAGRTNTDAFEGRVPLDLDLVIWDGKIIRPADFDRPYFNIGYRQLLAAGAFQYSV